jgi:hypothetical protein
MWWTSARLSNRLARDPSNCAHPPRWSLSCPTFLPQPRPPAHLSAFTFLLPRSRLDPLVAHRRRWHTLAMRLHNLTTITSRLPRRPFTSVKLFRLSNSSKSIPMTFLLPTRRSSGPFVYGHLDELGALLRSKLSRYSISHSWLAFTTSCILRNAAVYDFSLSTFTCIDTTISIALVSIRRNITSIVVCNKLE